MKYIAPIFATLLAPIAALAATITWTPPTTYTDGSPIVAGTGITYSLYAAPTPTGTPVLVTANLTAPPVIDTPTKGCYWMSATVNGAESTLTGPACAPTAPPTGVKVAAQTTAPTAFTLVKVQDSFAFLPIGTVPLGTPCDPLSAAENPTGVFMAIPKSAVTYSGDVRTSVVLGVCG